MLGAIRDRIIHFAPDIVATLRRFPFASLLIVLVTVFALLLINVIEVDDEDFWIRLLAGLGTGAFFATAGALFAEARGRRGLLEQALIYIPALVTIGLLQITDTRFALPWFLPIIGIFAMSLSLASGAPGDGQRRQDIFWWSNSRAITTAVIAGVSGILIVLGLFAIHWSMNFLFNLEISWIFENWLLPVVIFLLIPLYWLSTLPSLDEFGADALAPSDFLVRSCGFIGQFILIPFVLAYAVILHAYAVQVALAWQLPEGLLSWMVLYFLLAGLVTWLLTHPAFMREKPLVKLFRRSWFWLTIVPLVLLALATWVRIDAYGLTPLRVILVAIGLWTAALTLAFLWKRGEADIRLIPGLAGVVLIALSVGPLNPENLSRWQQLMRLDALLAEGVGLETWTDSQRRAARAAFDHLVYDDQAEADLRALLLRAGIGEASGSLHAHPVRVALGIVEGPFESGETGRRYYSLYADTLDAPVDLSETPYLLGMVRFGGNGFTGSLNAYGFAADGTRIVMSRDGVEIATLDIADWLARQTRDAPIAEPVLHIPLAEGGIVLVIREIFFSLDARGEERIVAIDSIEALGFTGRPEL